ncbi:MAG: hypothetical protein RLY86_2396 [Pseudomonadota bacterium]|jgi:hypothetical protein
MAYAWDEDEFPPPPTRAEVEAHIADWRQRVQDLFDRIEAWTADRPDLTIDRGDLPFTERRLQTLGITGPVLLPEMVIERRMQVVAAGGRTPLALGRTASRLRTDGMWVTPTRGQLRLFTPVPCQHIIADVGKVGLPEWRLVRQGAIASEPLTAEAFVSLLEY